MPTWLFVLLLGRIIIVYNNDDNATEIVFDLSMKPVFRDYLSFALELADEAGDILLSYYRSGVKTESKKDGSPVTVADREAEKAIRSRIEHRYPGHSVAGEEFGESAGDSDHRWIIDPLDGTRWFARGIPYYGVLISLQIGGRSVCGVAHFPSIRETVWASVGEGCYLNGKRVFVSGIKNIAEATASLAELEDFEKRGRMHVMRRLRKACKTLCGWPDGYGHALVATGRIELMLYPVLSPWDGGPFIPILQEAGGYFGDWSGNETIYGGEALSTSRALLAEVLQKVCQGNSVH